METVATLLTTTALKQIVIELSKKIVERVWDRETEKGKSVLRQLSEDSAASNYVEKYVSRFMRMRTLHSAESDVYLDEIYSPLTLQVHSNGDEFIVDDGFTLEFSRIINIIGIAGQGKSTILRKLFLEEMKKGAKFPFIIELRRIDNESIIEHFKSQLKDIGLSYGDDDVEILLQSKKVLLMLDGFDEIRTSNRIRLLSEIVQLNTRYNCNVIVTSRPGTEICSEVNITNLKVKFLDRADVVSMLEKLDRNKQSNEIPALINSNARLLEILVSPILVNLLYVCYPYLDVVPTNVVDFYDKLFITLYSRHDKIKNFNREKYSNVSAIDSMKIFNALCFDSLNKNSLEFNEESLSQFLSSSIKLNQIRDCQPEQIQKDLINITCLIQKDGFDKYVYLHKSVQEFHAAKFISSLPYEHKERFYSSLCLRLDHEDKFDNVLLFLKYIDNDEYNSLLLLKYFNVNKFNHLDTDSQDVILKPRVDDLLNRKLIKLTFINGSVKGNMMEGLSSNGFLSTLSFLQSDTRIASLTTEDLFTNHLFSLAEEQPFGKLINSELENIKGFTKESEKTDNNSGVKKVNYIVSYYDYLQSINAYEIFYELLKAEILDIYKAVYIPIYESNQQVSRILDIDFNV